MRIAAFKICKHLAGFLKKIILNPDVCLYISTIVIQICEYDWNVNKSIINEVYKSIKHKLSM